MAIKDILLYLDATEGCYSRIDLAVELARKHDAHLKGLYVRTHMYYAPRETAGAEEAANRVEAAFRAKVETAGISAEWLFIDWSVVGVNLAEVICLHAYYSDLVIIGQPGAGDQGDKIPGDLPERLGLTTGRPVLVVPYAGRFSGKFDQIMLAWRSGRESSRIALDALAIMALAKKVAVVTVSSKGEDDSQAISDAHKLCEYLGRHGVPASHEQLLALPNFPLGDVLLNYACDQKMDLLAMGVFAPSRRGVFAMGSIARHLLNHITLPLLISH